MNLVHFYVEAFMAAALLFVDGIVCGWLGYGKHAAPLEQGTTTVPRGGRCRDSLSATSMTVAIVLGGRAKLSRRTSSLGKSFVWRLGWDLHGMEEKSRAMVRGDESR